MNTSMIVGRLYVSFDRGTKTNMAPDIGLEEAPVETRDGGLVRGLGTHFRSPAAKENARTLSKEEVRIREAFRRAFLSSPIPGIYVLTERGAGTELLESLEILPAVAAHVSEYELSMTDELPPVEIKEWADRVKRQLTDVPMGKSKCPAAEGLATLACLAACPVLSQETQDEIASLIADAKLEAIDRVELKREIEFLDVQIVAPVKPRRVKAAAPVDVGKKSTPRRGPKVSAA